MRCFKNLHTIYSELPEGNCGNYLFYFTINDEYDFITVNFTNIVINIFL